VNGGFDLYLAKRYFVSQRMKPARLSLRAGDRTVTALGTAFDVRLDADKVQVTLLEVGSLCAASEKPPISRRSN